MKPPSESHELSAAELSQREEIESRILTRSSGRIGDGLDLIRIRDQKLYRDHESLEDYMQKRFDVHPGSAYRWMDAAATVKEIIDTISPKGEEDPNAWKVLLTHRNETAIRYLQKLETTENRWAVYRNAVHSCKGHEPKPRHLKKAAQTLGLMPKEDTRDSRTTNKKRAIQLILDVRDAAKADGRKLWATKLTDAIKRLFPHD